MSTSYFTRRILNSHGLSRSQTAIPVGQLSLSPAFA